RTDLLQLLATILNTRIVAGLAHLRPQLEIFYRAAAPNQELVVRQPFVIRGDAGNRAVLHRPRFRVAFPAVEIFAVEELPLLGDRCTENRDKESDRHDDVESLAGHNSALKM